MNENQIPTHIGIIMDGNRRYAKKVGLNPLKGHEEGTKTFDNILEWCKEINIKELTFYTLSTENLKRSKQEVDYLMDLFVKKAETVLDDKKLKEDDIKVNFIGRLNLLPKKVQEMMQKLMEKTKDNKTRIINFAMAYGGRAEIVDAFKKIANQIKEDKIQIEDINETTILNNLYLSSEPELIIRTSEKRLSGFLTYQSVYSEIIFLQDKLWPELTKEDFMNCIKEYQNTKKRFGK